MPDIHKSPGWKIQQTERLFPVKLIQSSTLKVRLFKYESSHPKAHYYEMKSNY